MYMHLTTTKHINIVMIYIRGHVPVAEGHRLAKVSDCKGIAEAGRSFL